MKHRKFHMTYSSGDSIIFSTRPSASHTVRPFCLFFSSVSPLNPLH